ncbi:MAG TPA: GYD domain-containing protein [Gaiellaceae bacterium]|nr:GYD domain-containing protein [Gaiellaceae bacterium]
MPQFLVQFSYVSRSKKGLIEQPDVDHAAQASKMVASLGGEVLGYWYAFGEFDGMVLIEAPDSTTVAAVAMAIGGTGEVSRLETTVLMTMDEARVAARKAQTATHLPPGEEGDR